jgi:trypsin
VTLLGVLLVATFFVRYTSGYPTFSHNVRIVGGHNISIQEVPYQISLQHDGDHFCGGSIISPNYIVTASHCTSFYDASSLTIRAGTSTRGVGGQVINVSKIYNHPNFTEQNADCDISVLELSANLTLGINVAAIALPSLNQKWPVGTEVLVTGWGLLSWNSTDLPEDLQGVSLNLVSQESCREAYGENAVTDYMMCAGVSGGGKSACSEDSGGPLQVDNILAGVVSWSKECGLPDYPGVYARVSALRQFIQDVTGL